MFSILLGLLLGFILLFICGIIISAKAMKNEDADLNMKATKIFVVANMGIRINIILFIIWFIYKIFVK